jgi:E3 ubiquitin-protein ligase UBR4
VYSEFSSLCGDTEQLEFLLNNIKCTFVRSHPLLLQALMRLIPYISFGDEQKMHALIAYFSIYYTNFDHFEAVLHLECFCVIVNGIEIGAMGTRLRDMMLEAGVPLTAIDYLRKHAPAEGLMQKEKLVKQGRA